jgi:transposase
LYPGAGQTRDLAGAAGLPAVKVLLADRGHDADWLRNTLIDMGITRCIPLRKNRKVHIGHDAVLYKKRHKVENMFGLERVAFNQVHLIERNSQHYQRLACLGLHSI